MLVVFGCLIIDENSQVLVGLEVGTVGLLHLFCDHLVAASPCLALHVWAIVEWNGAVIIFSCVYLCKM